MSVEKPAQPFSLLDYLTRNKREPSPITNSPYAHSPSLITTPPDVENVLQDSRQLTQQFMKRFPSFKLECQFIFTESDCNDSQAEIIPVTIQKPKKQFRFQRI